MLRLRQNLQMDAEEAGVLLLDIFDVDQYGRLLADVRGLRVGERSTLLERFSFAEDCVRSGWAHTTPFHICPMNVANAFNLVKTNLLGAWGLETDEQPFQGVLHRCV